MYVAVRTIEREGLLPNCRIGVKDSESEDVRFKLNVLAAHMATYFLNYMYGESDDCVTGQGMLRVTGSCTLASGMNLA